MRFDVACVAAVFLHESLANETLVENLVAGMIVLEVLHVFVVSRELLEAEMAVESIELSPGSRFCSWFGFIGIFFKVRQVLVGCELFYDVVLFFRGFRWSFIADCRSWSLLVFMELSLSFSRFLLVFSENNLQNALIFSRCCVEFIELIQFCEAIEADEGGKLAFGIDLKKTNENSKKFNENIENHSHLYSEA
jgi:hypothetical protein